MPNPLRHNPATNLSSRAIWWLSLGAWLLALVLLIAGTWIGLKVHPGVGAALWVGAAVLSFLPFLSERTRHTGWWSQRL